MARVPGPPGLDLAGLYGQFRCCKQNCGKFAKLTDCPNGCCAVHLAQYEGWSVGNNKKSATCVRCAVLDGPTLCYTREYMWSHTAGELSLIHI